MPLEPELVKQGSCQFKLEHVPAFHPFLSTAARYPKDTALLYQDFSLTYGQWRKLALRFAANLSGSTEKGDRVAIYMPNCPQFAIAYMGILLAGDVFVGCDTLLSTYELDYQLTHSGAQTIVTTEDLLPKVQQCQHVKSVKKVIVSQPEKECEALLTTDCSPWREEGKIASFRAMLTGQDDFIPGKIVAKKDIAHILYTGGTTGIPKGVIHTHYNVVTKIVTLIRMNTGVTPQLDKQGFWRIENDPRDLSQNWEYPLRVGRERALIIVPWTHVMGILVNLLQPSALALKMFLVKRFDAQEVLRRIQEWDITCSGGAPSIISYLVSHPDFETTDLSSVKLWEFGGAALPEEHFHKFRKKVGDVVVASYGLTESMAAICRNPANRSGLRKSSSCGIVLPNVEVKLIDKEGNDVPTGKVGEVVARGPQISPGYFNQPDETKKAFHEGWLLTGDLARIDKDGYLFIVDRKKELIIYKGYNVYPRELEEIICRHPAVKECAVLGKKDMHSGERPVAFVSLKENNADLEEIENFVNERVSSYKKIREIYSMKNLPLTDAGKISKKDLKEYLESK